MSSSPANLYWITCLHLSAGAVCVFVCVCVSGAYNVRLQNEKAREANLDTSALAECVMY